MKLLILSILFLSVTGCVMLVSSPDQSNEARANADTAMLMLICKRLGVTPQELADKVASLEHDMAQNKQETP